MKLSYLTTSGSRRLSTVTLSPALTTSLGNAKSTSTRDLNLAGEQLLGEFYRGAYPAGSEPEPDGTRHIVLYNTMDRPPGEHWLAEYREGDIRLLYDSFGRLPSAHLDNLGGSGGTGQFTDTILAGAGLTVHGAGFLSYLVAPNGPLYTKTCNLSDF